MSIPQPSRRLALTVRLASGGLAEAADAFWTHPDLARAFPEYQFRLYCSVRASVPLMRVAREQARALADTCPVAARLVPYLTKHIREETGHDEWLLTDMILLGVEREAALARVPPREIAALIGSLYYWIFHAHPVALLAYFFVVEGNPFSEEMLDEVVARTGLPRKALRTFYKHAYLDAKHGADVAAILDELPLTDRHVEILSMSAISVVEQLALFMERLVRHADGLPATSPHPLADAV